MTRRLLEQPWLHPGAVTLRFDPVIGVLTPGGRVFGNLHAAVPRSVLEPFVQMGIRRVVTSRGDGVRYPRVVERMASVDLRWLPIDDRTAAAFCRSLDLWCKDRGVSFSVCCEPAVPDLVGRWGCIDADHLNRLAPDRAPATRWLHNRIGKQRPACRCTYSKDIGYTTGAARCFSGGFGCLYCYAQGRAGVPRAAALRSDIQAFDRDPRDYLAAHGLPSALWLREGLPSAGDLG